MNWNGKAPWVTRTAAFTALLVVLQAVTAPLGNTVLTGSLVNALLIVSVMTCGLRTGISAAAKLIGIGPLWSLIPFIIAGNAALVLCWHLIGNGKRHHLSAAAAVVAAALAKFLVLYTGVVKVAIPLLLDLPAPQAAAVSGMFSVPQLVTAVTGGALAAVLIPRLKRAAAGAR